MQLMPILHVTVDVSEMTLTGAAKYMSDLETKFKESVTDRIVIVTSNRVNINCSINE